MKPLLEWLDKKGYGLKIRDFLKGLLMAFGTSFFAVIAQWLNVGSIPTKEQFNVALVAGLSASVFYLGKNFFTNDVKVAHKILLKDAKKQMEKYQEDDRS